MKWFDAGVNLLDPRFDLAELLDESAEAGVTDLLVISSNIAESEQAVAMVLSHSSKQISLHTTAGIHPHHADHACAQSWSKLRSLLVDTAVCAVGECGLDFNRNFSTQQNQIQAFDAQLQIAVEHQKGVYLHERDAFAEQCKMLLPVYQHLPFLVAHCFTGTPAQMQTYLDMGCYIGITGWVCDDARGASLQQAVKDLPLDRLLLETDAPYLFPKTVRPRSKQNAPKYLVAIAEKVAQIKQLPVQRIAQSAYANAKSLFTD
jgi:TatD DNase family protein